MKSIVLLFFKILKIIFLSKKIYKLPKKSDILIFDNTGAEILKTLIPKNTSIEILFTRNERINILIFLKSIWKVGNLKENYIFEFISQVEPKIIITYIDNNLFYYSIKKHFPKIKFISIQNGKRDNVFFDKLQKNFETAEVDYLFCFGEYIKKIYEKNIKSKIITIGSIKNNQIIRRNFNKKGILFISEYTTSKKKVNFKLKKNLAVSANDFWNEPQKKIINFLIKYCQKKNIYLKVLARPGNNPSEIMFFDKLKKKYKSDFKLVFPKTIAESYLECDKSEIVITIDSTLGYESAVRGNKTAFFSIRSRLFNCEERHFSWPKKNFKKEIFWTDKINDNNFKLILDKLSKINIQSYKKLLLKTNFNKIMFYNKKNTKITKIIGNLTKH